MYDLLDSLVVMRLDFGKNVEGKAAALARGPEKDIIGELDRPAPG